MDAPESTDVLMEGMYVHIPGLPPHVDSAPSPHASWSEPVVRPDSPTVPTHAEPFEDLFGDNDGGATGALEEDAFEAMLDESTMSDRTSDCWPASDTEAATSTIGSDDGTKMCVVCEVQPRRRRNSFCSVCDPDGRACRADARKAGQAALDEWKAALKDGAKMKELILSYKSRCRAQGRGNCRPAFDWMRYKQTQEAKSEMQKGEFVIWMTKHRWFSHTKQWEGEHWTNCESQGRWDRLLEDLPSDKVSDDKKMVHVPLYMGGFSSTVNSRSHSEQLEVGHREKKGHLHWTIHRGCVGLERITAGGVISARVWALHVSRMTT